jgi:hypothetical protein
LVAAQRQAMEVYVVAVEKNIPLLYNDIVYQEDSADIKLYDHAETRLSDTDEALLNAETAVIPRGETGRYWQLTTHPLDTPISAKLDVRQFYAKEIFPYGQ